MINLKELKVHTINLKSLVQVLLAFVLIIAFQSKSFAQCGCIIDNFGTPSSGTCTGQITTSPYVPTVNYGYYTGSGQFQDGHYQVACDGSNGFNFGWYGGASGTFASDHTTGSGNLLMVNGATGLEFYHRTLTGLCTNTTYTLKFYVANASRYSSGSCYYGNLPDVSAYVFPSGTAVQTSAFSGTGGTLLGSTGNVGCGTSTTNPTWNQYSYSFTTGSSQTSLDLILVSVYGNNAGYDYYVDDISFIKSSGSCTLPVELLSFTAEQAPQNIILKWSTASEINNDYFAVEKSSDGVQFNQIGTVKGNGNSKQIINYSFDDYSQNTGTAYYRLKQVDYDYNYEYSPITSVSFDRQEPVTIFNDPSNQDGGIIIRFNEKGLATFNVIDLLGRVVYSGSRESDAASVAINKNILTSGIYIVKVFRANELVSKKVVLN